MTPIQRDRADLAVIGDGPRDLLVLHGLGGDRRQPLRITGDTPTPGWRVIAPDQRAHGSSSLDPSAQHLTFQRLAADVEDLLLSKDTGARPTVVMGISMGAAVALRVTLRGQLRVRGLLLIRPAWLHEPNPPGLAPFPVIADLLRTRGPVEGAGEFRLTSHYQTVEQVSAAAADALLDQFSQPRAAERSARLERLPSCAPYRQGDLATLDLPATVVASPGDPVHPAALAQRLHQALPGSALVEAPPRYDFPEAHRRAAAAHLHQLLVEA